MIDATERLSPSEFQITYSALSTRCFTVMLQEEEPPEELRGTVGRASAAAVLADSCIPAAAAASLVTARMWSGCTPFCEFEGKQRRRRRKGRFFLPAL